MLELIDCIRQTLKEEGNNHNNIDSKFYREYGFLKSRKQRIEKKIIN